MTSDEGIINTNTNTLPKYDECFTGRESGKNLVFVGKITKLEKIEGADHILSATVVCGKGGIWRGVVRKKEFQEGRLCLVFLPDSLIPKNLGLDFMEKSQWRVRMQRFKGSPSEVLITELRFCLSSNLQVGDDVTHLLGVTKYFKPIPVSLAGLAEGLFPSFIPKTDEPNYQTVPEMVRQMEDCCYYITEKCDGSSTTVFRYKNEFGVCSRNLQLRPDENNGYWQVVNKYKLRENIMNNYAIQFETCGPGIQKNPMGLSEIDGFMFSAYNIAERRYVSYNDMKILSDILQFPMVKVLETGYCFYSDDLQKMAEGNYDNGKPREGIVIRSQNNENNGKPLSFKVINLDYDK